MKKNVNLIKIIKKKHQTKQFTKLYFSGIAYFVVELEQTKKLNNTNLKKIL